MNQSRILEIERRLRKLSDALAAVRALVNKLNQSLPWAFGGNGGGDGGAVHWYYARSDGAAQATGTFPSITPDSFTSDVLDTESGEVVAVGASIEWWWTDPLTTEDALVLCVKKADGSYMGVVEQCSPIDEDEE